MDPQLRRPCRARDADPTERPPIGTHPLVAVALSIAERRGLPGKPRQIGTGQHPLPRVGSPHRDGDLTPRIASQPARLTAASPVRGLSGLSSPVAQSDAVRRDRAHFRRCDRRALPLDPRPGAILHTLAAAPSWPLVATPGPATWGKASHDVRRASE